MPPRWSKPIEYLEKKFLPWWNQNAESGAANAADAHRALGPPHDLPSALSHVESRRVANDYTIRYQGKMYQIAQSGIRPGLRGGTVRVELRLDGSLAVRFWRRLARHQRVPGAAESAQRWPITARRGASCVQHPGRNVQQPGGAARRICSSPESVSARLPRSIAPAPATDWIEKVNLDRRAKAARRSSRFIAQSLRSGAFTKLMRQKAKTPESCTRGLACRSLRSQLRRLGFGHPFGRDPVRTPST